jgi:hypothetical protein
MSEYEYPLSTGRSNILGTEAFRDLLGQSLLTTENKVVILSAYVKVIGVEWLKEKLINKDIKCVVIARWDKSDIAQGSSDLDCYKICKDNNWQFRILKDLHAKIMLVDNKDLFIGSPNLTGHGMSLIPVSNKEMGVKLDATSSDINIINNLIEESVIIDDTIFEQLKLWKDKLPEIKKQSFPSFPKIVGDKLKENFDKVWVHNFPWSTVDELLNIKDMNENIQHDLELFGLSKKNINHNVLKKNLENSKIFKWLINKLKKQENNEIYFGKLSSIIHNSLLDDPKPYRKGVKDLQINLYSFLKKIKFDYLEISVPFAKSERIKLLMNK